MEEPSPDLRKLDVTSISNLIKGIDESQCIAYGKRCSVALESMNHNSETPIGVQGEIDEVFNIKWQVQENKAGFREPKKNVELGAVALSFLLLNQATGFNCFYEAFQGEGVDYWISYPESHEEYDEFNFMNARLEISGIGKESSTNTIEKRATEKEQQSKISDGSATDAYISIIEFGTPKAILKKR